VDGSRVEVMVRWLDCEELLRLSAPVLDLWEETRSSPTELVASRISMSKVLVHG
jgi:hypothetical protein